MTSARRQALADLDRLTTQLRDGTAELARRLATVERWVRTTARHAALGVLLALGLAAALDPGTPPGPAPAVWTVHPATPDEQVLHDLHQLLDRQRAALQHSGEVTGR